MYEKQENIFYFLTVMNEFYPMPPMPDGVREGILKGLYKFKESKNSRVKYKAHLLGSGTILNEAVKAQQILEDKFGIAADVWSVTSYKELYRNAVDCARWNMLHPDKSPKIPYVIQCFTKEKGVFIYFKDTKSTIQTKKSRTKNIQ